MCVGCERLSDRAKPPRITGAQACTHPVVLAGEAVHDGVDAVRDVPLPAEGLQVEGRDQQGGVGHLYKFLLLCGLGCFIRPIDQQNTHIRSIAAHTGHKQFPSSQSNYHLGGRRLHALRHALVAGDGAGVEALEHVLLVHVPALHLHVFDTWLYVLRADI